MRYVATITTEGVIVSKGINYTDFVDKNEIELTEEEYASIPIPCKKENGVFVPCDFPESSGSEGTSTYEPEPTTEELLNIILGVE